MKRIMNFSIILIMAGMFILTSCKPKPVSQTPEPTIEVIPTTELTIIETAIVRDEDWWTTAVFYEIFVRSFYDSNGDGIGDFNGITQKLDYLNDGDPDTSDDLGITGIWLMPIFPSPSYHGYDVTDYLAVNPDYGTMEDFENLLAEAHKRGIHVIIDFVINHTSSQHPWFQAAQDPSSPYRDYYVWSETNPGFAGPWGNTVWIPTKNGYYYALFWDQMPDLNYRNPKVTEEIYNITRFWLEDVGVDGFRVDAARHLIEDGDVQMNTPETHEWFKGWRTYYKSINPNSMTIGEIWDSTSAVAKYLQGDELDLAFNFDMSDAWISEISGGTTNILNFIYKYEFERTKNTLFATFLTNHDMNRVISQLNGDVEKAKLGATLMLTFPGVPFIYYGEEIGMKGVKPDEDIRLPMQWSPEAVAGFSTGAPWRAVNSDYQTVNVAIEDGDVNSIINQYRELIHLRLDNSALQLGSLLPVTSSNNRVLAFVREDANQTILVLVNISSQDVKNAGLTLEASLVTGIVSPQVMFGNATPINLTVDENGGFADYVPVDLVKAKTAIVLKLR